MGASRTYSSDCRLFKSHWQSNRPASRRLPLERLHQPTDVGFDLHLFDTQLLHLIWLFANRWQMIPLHMAAAMVVVFREFSQQMIEVPLTDAFRD